MNPLVLYHANCADGYGAAFAAWTKFGGAAEYVAIAYSDVKSTLDMDLLGNIERDVYILDFSFPRQVMALILKHAHKVVWLDHHKTAFEMWCNEMPADGYYSHRVADPRVTTPQHIILDNNKSGALLAWEYFHPDTEVPRLIRHIDDYDRWQFKIEGTRELNAALRSLEPWSFKQWEQSFLPADMGKSSLTFDQTAQYHALMRDGIAILRAHNRNVVAVLNASATLCRIIATDPKEDGEHCEANVLVDAAGIAANCPAHLTSDVGHELATHSNSYGLCWYLDNDNTARCSLRSNGDYDVSAIAKVFGGGGHKTAAGFSVDIHTLLRWLKTP